MDVLTSGEQTGPAARLLLGRPDAVSLPAMLGQAAQALIQLALRSIGEQRDPWLRDSIMDLGSFGICQ